MPDSERVTAPIDPIIKPHICVLDTGVLKTKKQIKRVKIGVKPLSIPAKLEETSVSAKGIKMRKKYFHKSQR